jgi:pyruvate-formate lyase-activating enzyme
MEHRSMVAREKAGLPRLVFADCNGAVYDHPHLKMAGRSGDSFALPDEEELVPLPRGSQLFTMPGRSPVGWNDEEERFFVLEEVPIAPKETESLAVAAFLPPGYTRTLLPATELHARWPILPLWAYCSVGWRAGKFWTTGIRVDSNPHWDPRYFQDDRHLASKVKQSLRDCEGNRLVEQLSRCALEYHCFAAKNAFYRRWECPLPTSPACNADCIGCLSSQPSEGCQASHERIAFVPTVEEVTQVALPHLQEAEDAIVSFGQGCEGEPLLQVDLLETSIATLRDKTDRGTINLNTNGSIPRFVERLCRVGLDSIRMTLNSTHPELYNTYFKPRGYEIGHVLESISRAKEQGVFTAINLLVFPGLTDQEEEVECLVSFIRETNVDMIQVRNLNIDPDLYLQALGCDGRKGIGIPNMLDCIRQKFPHLVLGYFNRTRETFAPNPPRDFSQSLG